jgi:hypothetical protein
MATRRPSTAKPSLLLIATGRLPTRCPSCGWKHPRTETRTGGWFRVSCTRGDEKVCRWTANYELKTDYSPLVEERA